MASHVPLKPANKLELKFRFHYHIIKAAISLSRGEESKKSKRKSVAHNRERDVRPTMPRSRAASSAGVVTQLLLARASYFTLTEMLTRLLVLRSSPQFLRKRTAVRNLLYAPSQSSANPQSCRKSSCKLV